MQPYYIYMLHLSEEFHVLNHVINVFFSIFTTYSLFLKQRSLLLLLVLGTSLFQTVFCYNFHCKDFFAFLIHAQFYFAIRASANSLLYNILVYSFDSSMLLRSDSTSSSHRVKSLHSLLDLTRYIACIRRCIGHYTLAGFLTTMTLCHRRM